jgi:Bacterial antitoxin of type II TA system, VapB
MIWAAISLAPYRWVMKTTIEISDPLLREARKLAEHEGVTLRALVERGLRRVVVKTKPDAPFKLRRASFKGKGLQAEARSASWDRLRDMAYEGRGG